MAGDASIQFGHIYTFLNHRTDEFLMRKALINWLCKACAVDLDFSVTQF